MTDEEIKEEEEIEEVTEEVSQEEVISEFPDADLGGVPEEVREMKDKTPTRKIVDLWDQFIESIATAEMVWIELNALFENDRPENYPDLPMKVQKGLAMFRRMKFKVMMPRFINYYVQSGGMEAIKSNIKKEGE